MAATASIEAIEWLRNRIEEAPDGLKAMLTGMVSILMSAEVDSLCGAGYGDRSDERVNSRNGYRSRLWGTRVGSIELAIPKLRHGSYFPAWLLQPRAGRKGRSPLSSPRRTRSGSRRGRSRT